MNVELSENLAQLQSMNAAINRIYGPETLDAMMAVPVEMEPPSDGEIVSLAVVAVSNFWGMTPEQALERLAAINPWRLKL